MSVRPVAASGAALSNATRGGILVPLGLSALLLAGMPCASRAAGNQAQSVLQKMSALYRTARTYQGSMVAHQTLSGQNGKTLNLTQTQQIKFKSPNKLYTQTSVSATGALAARVPKDTTIRVTDGRTFWAYSSAKKLYVKQAVPPQSKGFSVYQILQLPAPEAASVKLLPSSSVQGHAAYVVEMMPHLPQIPNLRPEDRAKLLKARQPARFYIDRQNYQLLKVTVGGKNHAEIDFGPQVINGAIADSAFTFTPPPGAKQFTPSPGGAPGTPRGRKR
ncbi:MAG TPA: DUF2092 domain-containing protein [Chthonomonadaceae bacterium]|nr:DUF2092 domain-containing protein [Chthonomonadaceae bacterium]